MINAVNLKTDSLTPMRKRGMLLLEYLWLLKVPYGGGDLPTPQCCADWCSFAYVGMENLWKGSNGQLQLQQHKEAAVLLSKWYGNWADFNLQNFKPERVCDWWSLPIDSNSCAAACLETSESLWSCIWDSGWVRSIVGWLWNCEFFFWWGWLVGGGGGLERCTNVSITCKFLKWMHMYVYPWWSWSVIRVTSLGRSYQMKISSPACTDLVPTPVKDAQSSRT